MSRFHPRSLAEEIARGAFKERGAHTLDVHVGEVIGVNRDDVFVELEPTPGQEDGPRKQGLIDRYAFERDPRVGDRHEFTLRGREDALWVLNLVDEETLEQWEDLEEGSLLTARVLQQTHDGYQLKVGPLHAFMPFSVSGVRRSRDRKALIGRSVVVLVLTVDDDKQRAVVSRKAVLQLQREGRGPGGVVPGQRVQGRVSRIEIYGAFIRFGQGREGLCHVSNLSVDRVSHPSEVVAVGDVVEARVLYVRSGGKRVGLGLKQMHESPWLRIACEHWEGQIVPVIVVRTGPFGAIARLAPGVEGIVPAAECAGLEPGRSLRVGDERSARVLEFDPEIERIAFSLSHPTGGPIERDEAETLSAYERERELPEVARVVAPVERDGAPLGTSLGALLKRALEGDAN